MVPISQGLFMSIVSFPSLDVWVPVTDVLRGAGRITVFLRQVVNDKSATVLWLLHQISLQIVPETNSVNGCASGEVGKVLELAEATYLLYAVLENLLRRLYLLAATCVRYWLLLVFLRGFIRLSFTHKISF